MTQTPLLSPKNLHDRYPLDPSTHAHVLKTREDITRIIQGKDERLLVIVGPCSIHDTQAATEYAEKLLSLRTKHRASLCILMRTYFQKPRTAMGWKGLINDPHLDHSYQINDGLAIARECLLQLNKMGMPTATEFLDPFTPTYLADLISWASLGARNIESQSHRELASDLQIPMGFKNSTSGSIEAAKNALNAAKHTHHFLTLSKNGLPVVKKTSGNPHTHLILRGGEHGPNHDPQSIKHAVRMLRQASLTERLMVDISHDNSPTGTEQLTVATALCKQIANQPNHLMGVMIESHLHAGQQPFNQRPLSYGKSITDPCIGWEETERVLEQLANAVTLRNSQKRSANLTL